ncbi:MAG TPA: TetR/AcrR family transcriptional regulator [Dehalococcoidia bacterium]
MPRKPRYLIEQERAREEAPPESGDRQGEAVGSPETRQRILEAARAVFAEYGYVDATVDHIISRCDVSRGTFYYYFKNKEDVFETLARMAVGELQEHAQRQLSGDHTYARIESGNRGYLETWAEYRDILRNLFQIATIEPRFAELQRELRMPFIDRIRRSLERRLAEGDVRPLHPGIVAFALAGMFDWFAYMWLGRDMVEVPDLTLDRVVQELTEIWYHAIYGGRPHLGGVDGAPEPAG